LGFLLAQTIGQKNDHASLTVWSKPFWDNFSTTLLRFYWSSTLQWSICRENLDLASVECLFFHYYSHSDITQAAKPELSRALMQNVRNKKVLRNKELTHYNPWTAWVYELEMGTVANSISSIQSIPKRLATAGRMAIKAWESLWQLLSRLSLILKFDTHNQPCSAIKKDWSCRKNQTQQKPNMRGFVPFWKDDFPSVSYPCFTRSWCMNYRWFIDSIVQI